MTSWNRSRGLSRTEQPGRYRPPRRRTGFDLDRLVGFVDTGDRLHLAHTSSPSPLGLPDSLAARAVLVLSTDPERTGGNVDPATLMLAPNEAVLLRPAD